MHKELIIATTSQETKIAILEDDELVEYYIERHRSQGIVGNIYKGRVTKVLPGMQSAFVDIGLERDAFLYVSDFFEDTEEYDKIVSTVEEEVAILQEGPRPQLPPAVPPIPAVVESPRVEVAPAAPAAEKVEKVERAEPDLPSPAVNPQARPADGRRPNPNPIQSPNQNPNARPGRDRDRDRRGGGKKPNIPSFEARTHDTHVAEGQVFGSIEALPGESLAKHSRRAPVAPVPTMAEPEPPAPLEESRVAAPVIDEPEQTQPPVGDAVTEPAESPVVSSSEVPEGDDAQPPSPSVRISDPSDNFRFAHRPAQRRPRRRGGNGGGEEERGGGAPSKPEDRRPNGQVTKPGPMIAELLREGQEILVQVSKEPLGKKGARITSHIALPGRYLVYMPTVDHVGVSRKISSDEERSRLKRIISEHKSGLPGGFIVRTAAEGRSEDEFVQDIRFLGNLWADIRSKSDKRAGPALIHRDLNLVQRMLRDQLSQDFSAIRIDSEPEFATILDFVNKFQPALVSRVKLHLKDTPIFEEHGLHTEIEKALRPKVWLKSGGYIVINQTEALVAIDVNTGKFVGKSNRLEDTITRTNVDAVHEIVRQIRLRNLGGIIVVDFIDMEEKKNRQRVMAALEEELQKDRSPSKILQFNDFGLVAITRKRTQPSLERIIGSPCGHCNGSGWVKSSETVCYDIQQEIKKMSHLLDGKEITVRVNPEVAKVLKGGGFVSLQEIEEWLKKDIVVKSDPLLHEEQFDIF